MHEFWQLFWQQMAETDALQWTATILGVAEVLLARVNNILLYPAGIIATVLSIYLFYHSGLYAEALLNGYYVVMSIYGWYYWMKKKNEPPVPITYCSRTDWMIVSAIVVRGFGALYVPRVA